MSRSHSLPIPAGRRCLIAAVLAVLAAGPGLLQAQTQAPPPASSVQFKHGDDALRSRVLLAVFGLVMLAAASVVAVRVARTRGWVSPAALRGGSLLRVVELRRVTPRLTVVALEIGPSRTVVFVDNGQALLLLDDSQAPRSPPGQGIGS